MMIDGLDEMVRIINRDDPARFWFTVVACVVVWVWGVVKASSVIVKMHPTIWPFS